MLLSFVRVVSSSMHNNKKYENQIIAYCPMDKKSNTMQHVSKHSSLIVGTVTREKAVFLLYHTLSYRT